ncbi:unnamed protein product [Toxocara canis]|uniref:Uncharacterized protein n=1 Tax=Toxocara canis TaxID=6265 RepID=A0A3P7IT89_TOXCA|nr:unnamed protein product [Toxocara canis]
MKALQTEYDEAKKAREGLAVKLKEKESVLAELMKEQAMDGDEIATLRQQLEDTQTSAASERERLEREVNELKVIAEEKSAMIRNLEADKENLTVELAASQELSKMHEHLQEQLKLARDERNETEKKYLEMERRAEKAAADLEVLMESMSVRSVKVLLKEFERSVEGVVSKLDRYDAVLFSEDRRLLAEARTELEKSRVEVHTKMAEVAHSEVSKEELNKMRANVEQVARGCDRANER